MTPTNDRDNSLAAEVIVGHYASRYHPTSVSRHPPTGFSGASIWRIEALAGNFCLRKWPTEHPTPERLRFIHEVLFHTSAGGFDRLALPVLNQQGDRFTRHAGHLWELAPWLPGEPKSAATISDEELRAALAALAEFHRAVASHPASGVKAGPAPAIASRLGAIARFDTWVAGFHPPADPADTAFTQAIHSILDAYRSRRAAMLADLHAVAAESFRLAPCLRDIWSDHVLLVAGNVSGLIDYGAMAVDTPATDVARLLGSYAVNDARLWQLGLDAYRQHFEFDPRQQRLAAMIDHTTAVLSGMHWIDWLFRDGRRFPDPQAVRERVISIAARLESLPAKVPDHPAW